MQTYTPNIAMSVNMLGEIDPRGPASVEIYMRNRNPLNIEDLRIVVESPLFTKEVQTTLGSLEEKTNQILLGMNALAEPGTYNVIIKLMIANKTISQTRSCQTSRARSPAGRR